MKGEPIDDDNDDDDDDIDDDYNLLLWWNRLAVQHTAVSGCEV